MEMKGLAYKYKTDKGKRHGYVRYYNRYFKDKRSDKIRLFEIGIATGASINMWLEYFKNGIIYCMDLSLEECGDLRNSRCFPFIGDQSNTDSYKNIHNIKFDYIIDDGSHVAEHQQTSLAYLFKNHLKEGGYYFIEDLHTKRKNKTKRTMEVLVDYYGNNKFYSGVITNEDNMYLTENIKSIDIFNPKICLIKKK